MHSMFIAFLEMVKNENNSDIDQQQKWIRNCNSWLGTVPHICNVSYSGGSDQEDQGWRPAQTKS
jgi:hypothetical protein